MLLNMAYEKGQRKFYQHETQRFNVLLGNASYDVLYIGSSRAHVHYNPKITDSITGLSSYNFGVEGGNLLETNLWLQAYLAAHPKPKLILLDIPLFAFDIDQRPFFNHTIYFPYLNNQVFYSTISQYKKIGSYKYIPFLELMEVDDYNKFNALKGLAGKKSKHSEGYSYNGFADNGTEIFSPTGYKAPVDTANTHLTQKGKDLLKAIIDTCNKKGIQLVMVYSPQYNEGHYTAHADFFRYLQEISARNKIPFYNYMEQPLSRDSSLFANAGHLNRKGAKIFSAAIANDILLKYLPR
jgi:hypothetical protein